MKVDWASFSKKLKRSKQKLPPIGSRVYKGFQGSGKTLSMVHYAFQVQKEFPDCLVFSNIKIEGLENYTYLGVGQAADYQLREALAMRSGNRGCLVLLDEAHLFFHKKTGIPLDVLTAISQQRKDRKRLVFSSQIWEELDISLRKQVKEIVSCRSILGLIQVNTVSDGESLSYDKLQSEYVSKKIRTEIFKHNSELYNCYDTLQKIVSNANYQRDFTHNDIRNSVEVNVRK